MEVSVSLFFSKDIPKVFEIFVKVFKYEYTAVFAFNIFWNIQLI